MSLLDAISTNRDMETNFVQLARDMLQQKPFDRGEVHAQRTTTPEMVSRELRHITQYFDVPEHASAWQEVVKPNLPWAEDHFQERVGGVPLNPPPEEANWPFAQQGNAAHKKDEKFSHTYPERFWPKFAGSDNPEPDPHWDINQGIRFPYGDLNDLVDVLAKNPRSRQAYLPVWFPEDLYAAAEGERVPCTLGYHFLLRPDNCLDVTYNMRSCDMMRFYRDDVYMAGRLLQWVVYQVNMTEGDQKAELSPGDLVLHIANLHTFVGDEMILKNLVNSWKPRDKYDFGAML